MAPSLSMGPSPSMAPSVLPPEPKGVSRGAVVGIFLGTIAVLGVVGSEILAVKHCAGKYSVASDISGAWNIVTLGMCYCLVKLGNRDRGYLNINKHSESRKGLTDDEDDRGGL